MPISRRGALDASHLDGVLTLDVERGVAAIDLAEVSFVDVYALAGSRASSERLEGGVDAEVVNQLFEATGELGLNVVEHAGSPAGGFVAAQRYKAGMPEERIVVAVGDVGIGIRESLRPRYGVMTDDEAIRRAVQWNVSRVPEQGRDRTEVRSPCRRSSPPSWCRAAPRRES